MSAFHSLKSGKTSSNLPGLKTSTLQSRASAAAITKVSKKKAKTSLKDIQNTLRSYNHKSQKKSLEYQGLVFFLREAELRDSEVRMVIDEASNCIPVLNEDLSLFVEALLSINWINRSGGIISKYQSFLVNLLSAHNCHTKFAIGRLVKHFVEGDEDGEEWKNGNPDEMERAKYVKVHCILKVLTEIIPMSKEIIVQCLVQCYPYIKKSTHVHEVYIFNLLWILDYQPGFRSEILKLIISKLVLFDVNASRESIEEAETVMECDMFEMNDVNRLKHPIAHTMDICMEKLFQFLISECHDETGAVDWEKSKGIYQETLKIFDEVILPTYNTHHVQFFMFLICSFKTAISEVFLNYLWKKITTPTVPIVMRQAASAYLASLIARGNFIPLEMIKGTLQQMAGWIHSYILSQDGNEYMNVDLRVHGAFYCVCQSLFYVVAFRHRELVSRKKGLTFLQSLNLAKMVTCKLNPLRVIQPAVVQNFASVARTYQLAYCYSIIEHNSRNSIPTVYYDEKGSVVTNSNVLDTCFPFDPYLLKRSGEKIWPFYVNYKKIEEPSSRQNNDMEDDDFLYDNPELAKFSYYGSSPGFKD